MNLLKKLIDENSGDFENQSEIDECLDRLRGPFSDLAEPWANYVSPSIQTHWGELGLDARFLVMIHCMEIHSLNVIADDYKRAFYKASSMK